MDIKKSGIEFEKKIKKLLKHEGYEVLKNGWPDYLVKDKEGILWFMEIKALHSHLRKAQKQMLKTLTDADLNVLVVSENKLSAPREWIKAKNYTLGDIQDDKIEPSIDRIIGYIQKVTDILPQKAKGKLDLEAILNEIETTILKESLIECKGDKRMAAKLLNISSRSLRYRINKLGIEG